ncbi:MAG: methylisocitrate lyase [Nisaea sp.]|jgi:methylisocitrate lyase|nr:methylisocitrate lyase [Nisaea sp.]MDA8574325.1 methylisocitrate lyase [Alphaproteobacteria bacterium]OUX92302.1 MAG: methylisocitrate lyase [Candidatus Endolissoclinum sp. TMED26]
MTWFDSGRSTPPMGERLQLLWERPEILQTPGAHNALSALLAKRAGFEALYLSGGAVSASLGLPDLGVMTIEEVLVFVRSITRATDLPLIVDGDTGYGEALNVMRLVRDLEDAGAAAVQLEDQILPKKCGHLSDKRLVEPEAMAAKIAAAVKSRRHLRIIARTDAIASEGLDAAISRAQLYRAAGADMIFPEALIDAEDMARFTAAVSAPMLANMTEFGKTPYLTAAQFQDLGFDLVIWPVSSLRAAAERIDTLYKHLASDGGQGGFLDQMMSRKEIYEVIGYHDYEALDDSIAQSIVPDV